MAKQVFRVEVLAWVVISYMLSILGLGILFWLFKITFAKSLFMFFMFCILVNLGISYVCFRMLSRRYKELEDMRYWE